MAVSTSRIDILMCIEPTIVIRRSQPSWCTVIDHFRNFVEFMDMNL